MPDSLSDDTVRHNWTRDEIAALFDLPLPELIFQAQLAHRRMLAEIEIIIAGEGEQALAAALDPNSVLARAVAQGTAAVFSVEVAELGRGEFIERAHA